MNEALSLSFTGVHVFSIILPLNFQLNGNFKNEKSTRPIYKFNATFKTYLPLPHHVESIF